MLYHPLTHLLIGSVLRSALLQHPSGRWDPASEPFSAAALALDVAALLVFTWASWAFTRWCVTRSSPFGEAERSLDGVVAARDQLVSRPLMWWFLTSFAASAVVLAAISVVDTAVVQAPPRDLPLVVLALAFAAVLLLHEAVHVLAAHGLRHLRLVLRPHLGLGGLALDLQGELGRARLLALQLMPLLALTAAPLAAAPFIEAPAWRAGAVIVACLNALLSGTDVVSAVMLLRQVPRGAIVVFAGTDVRWRDARQERYPNSVG